MSTPQYSLSERGSSRKLQIGQWTIQSTKKPILNGREIDAAAEHIDIPLPEMTFGNNSLLLSYAPADPTASSSTPPTPKIGICFDALSCLAEVATGDGWEERVGGGVQVSMAEEWGKKRSTSAAQLSDMPIPSKPTKPHDWTYSTILAGQVSPGHCFKPTTTDSIPMETLARQDPVLDRIIFYDDIPLFEDELHDNGESILSVRIRVMPHSFFILQRLFLRVDNVLFRIHDARIYHEFGTDKVIRETTGLEASYADVKRRLESQNDLTPLTNPNYISQLLSSLASETVLVPKEFERKPWPGLGTRRDVLLLSVEGLGVRDVGEKLAGVKI